MAKMYPSISEEFHNSLGEYKIFNALKQLPDDWYVFYSVNWNSKLNTGKVTWGEADFVIYNRLYGMLVVEVKSGGIEFKNGEWLQTRLDTNEKYKMKNPFTQANRSKYKLIDLFDNYLPNYEKCFVDKAVWFPSINNVDNINLPMEYNRSLVLTSEALENPLKYIIQAFDFYNSKHFNNLSKDGSKKLLNIIMPEFDLVPSSSNIKEEIDFSFYQLTSSQKKVLDFIGEQENAAIQGGAGTGKTFIAVEQARRFAADGKVLFLCFNKYLYKHLSNNCFNNNVDYYNIHTFLGKFTDENLYTTNNLLKVLRTIDLAELNYKYLIIDEAQDIDNDVLSLLLTNSKDKNIKCFVFYDKNQLLYSKKMPNILNDFDCKLTLTKNCRNTLKILSTVNSSLSIPIKTNDYYIVGNMPRLFYSNQTASIISKLEEVINNYLNDGYSEEDITILTLKTEDKSIIGSSMKIGKNYIKRESDDSGIFFTTAKKFKGLESNVVLLVDFDSDILSDEENLRLFYVSTSRAKQKLDIFYLNNNNDIQILADKLDGKHNSYVKISTKFKVILSEIK